MSLKEKLLSPIIWVNLLLMLLVMILLSIGVWIWLGKYTHHGEEIEVQSDFVLALNAKEFMLRQSGCYEIANLKDDEILQILNEKSPQFNYKNAITYDLQICDYHHRRDEICAKCAEICPSVAILKDEENKELVISHIDCIGCGRCVGVGENAHHRAQRTQVVGLVMPIDA